MSDLSETPEAFLLPIARVIESILAHASALQSDDVMVVGAWCRDIWHHALGHTFATAATRDLDLALALSSWEAFDDLAGAFPRIGDTGIRFRIAGITVDLLPFGEIERPRGTTHPPTRDTAMSVWALEEIKAASRPSPAPRGWRRAHPERGGFRGCQARCVARPVRMARSQGCDRPGSDPVLVRRVARGPRSALRLCPRERHPGRRVGGPTTSGGRASRSRRCQHHRSGADIGALGPVARRRADVGSRAPVLRRTIVARRSRPSSRARRGVDRRTSRRAGGNDLTESERILALERELGELRQENARLTRLLELTKDEAEPAKGSQTAWFDQAPGSVTSESSPDAKVAFFAALFGARRDVYACGGRTPARASRGGCRPSRAAGARARGRRISAICR